MSFETCLNLECPSTECGLDLGPVLHPVSCPKLKISIELHPSSPQDLQGVSPPARRRQAQERRLPGVPQAEGLEGGERGGGGGALQGGDHVRRRGERGERQRSACKTETEDAAARREQGSAEAVQRGARLGAPVGRGRQPRPSTSGRLRSHGRLHRRRHGPRRLGQRDRIGHWRLSFEVQPMRKGVQVCSELELK